MTKIYAVIDTNVIVSALYSHKTDAATILVLDYLTQGILQPLVNNEILAEYKEVLFRKKFNFSPEIVTEWLQFFETYGISTERTASSEKFIDEKDIIFYEVTLSVEDSFLVTGNKKHFPQTPNVVSPAEMVAILTLLENDK
ncbi:MAG: putative toxin-antitoxin system toxin component, PIN family [Bacteroidales bacterium]|jgi:putative PIN family toxin of toxin-antitoxin system|nr:putative toxin-antitoxin system toxin component, PIN family [Bacteroidales bacterium]